MSQPILNARYAKRGATGTTDIALVTRFQVRPNAAVKRSRGGTLLGKQSFIVGAAAQIVVETESFAECVSHVGQSAVELLVLGFKDGAGHQKLSVHVSAAGFQDSEFPPPEGQGDVPRYQLTFDVVSDPADPNETLAQALAISADV